MIRTGLGYDSHKFAPDRPLMLGGVQIDFDKGLAAHSDGDVVLHALVDAIFGAMAAGDIGEHFPDNDPKWQNADSSKFVTYARQLAADAGWSIANCDITILAEAPKLSPYKLQIAERIAGLLQISPDAVSVKAKTNEGMGFIGQGEGIAVLANVLIEK
ncbi:MAG: 2-C-methyl-D-erythritol 2,4-cyclodiphosphate synthase [Phycisphaerae bacterium]|nr:2-C-methyl-D-erythritol 2,4-cyclodiphosphate synthase [Phycisphaerae bacterium]